MGNQATIDRGISAFAKVFTELAKLDKPALPKPKK